MPRRSLRLQRAVVPFVILSAAKDLALREDDNLASSTLGEREGRSPSQKDVGAGGWESPDHLL
jgi:hypothetical protein